MGGAQTSPVRLWLVREERDVAEMQSALPFSGVCFEPLPLLETRLLSLPDGAFDPRLCAGLVFTSANGVRFFQRMIGKNARFRGHDGNIKIWTVGPQTAETARRAGYADVRCGSGTAADLAGEIVFGEGAGEGAGVLYWPARDTPSFPLAEVLSARGISCFHLPVYTALAVDAFPAAFLSALAAGEVDGVGFFSMQGAQAFQRLVSCAGHDGLSAALSSINALCLRKRMVESLEGIFGRVYTAEAPDRDRFFSLVQRVYGIENG